MIVHMQRRHAKSNRQGSDKVCDMRVLFAEGCISGLLPDIGDIRNDASEKDLIV